MLKSTRFHSLKTFVDDIKVQPKHNVANKGANTFFLCYSSVSPNWTFNGGGILPNNTRVNEQENKIYIHNVDTSNRGYYECMGANFENEVFVSRASLTVKSKLYFV